ncbi:hypothetical protein ASPWEDRAFT_314624 [Aspergillus wentii DTO 134E9]|uniref:Rpr2-domain-containing protein n=1 Tax=Aspergillus wentii DTO 134E9 TaxID=1073089 RepID=A0A1L9RTG5_ASPWE|nr:uncharacterized protein ASPWEDRAFT_314624 [Aspergillus wentii DTO 134E9]OJJ38215.1 hypothetical protein ASPWEDRAFT_314624 [Aspergillus wentii DTO 134E9]
MAKNKGKKGSAGGVNSHLRARLSYLHNAANYLQSATKSKQSEQSVDQNTSDGNNNSAPNVTRTVPHIVMPRISSEETQDTVNQTATSKHSPHLSRVFISQMRGVSLKSQLRLPIEVKRSYCKRCDTLLIPEVSCTQETRNASRGRKKPWADVRVVRCTTCGTEKRFPQTEKRSKRLPQRQKEKQQEEQRTAET